jgi:hypothetical protein
VIANFTRSGIRLTGTGDHLIKGNHIHGNYHGIIVERGSVHNTIGGTTDGARNVIGGHTATGFGIGLLLKSANNRVHGNYIGLDPTGGMRDENRIGVKVEGLDNVIGEIPSAAGAGNVISGNRESGVRIERGDSPSGITGDRARLVMNRIGTDALGSARVPNLNGVVVDNANEVRIGRPGAGNLISGNIDFGVRVRCTRQSGCPGTLIQGNTIGTNAAGRARLRNSHGVGLHGGGTATVGGAVAGAGNLISGNFGNGVEIRGSFLEERVVKHTVQGNIVGPDRRLLNAGNGQYGMYIEDVSRVKIGGSTRAEGNTVAYNAKGGIFVDRHANRVSILSNRISANSGLGIDLWPPGVNPVGRDGHDGANFWQSFPVLSRVTTDGVSGTTFEGTLQSSFDRVYTIQLFSNVAACHRSGYGDGFGLVGSIAVRTDRVGHARFGRSLRVVVDVGDFVTATATDPAGNTSEFSKCVKVKRS